MQSPLLIIWCIDLGCEKQWKPLENSFLHENSIWRLQVRWKWRRQQYNNVGFLNTSVLYQGKKQDDSRASFNYLSTIQLFTIWLATRSLAKERSDNAKALSIETFLVHKQASISSPGRACRYLDPTALDRRICAWTIKIDRAKISLSDDLLNTERTNAIQWSAS